MNKLLFFIFIIIVGCNSSEEKQLDAQIIVNKAIKASGTEKLKYSLVEYNFRNYKFISEGKCNHFIFKRISTKNDSVITDIYNTQKGLHRVVDENDINLSDSIAFKYAESINSVNYFIQLPMRLNDNAVHKKYLGIDTLKGKAHYKILVTFNEENGGEDHEDKYLYWFDKDNFKLNFLAYSFKVNGGGIRFREAYNERFIDNIRFVDYKNYKPTDEKTDLKNVSTKYNNNELELLSKIENDIILIKKLSEKC